MFTVTMLLKVVSEYMYMCAQKGLCELPVRAGALTVSLPISVSLLKQKQRDHRIRKEAERQRKGRTKKDMKLNSFMWIQEY